MAAKKESVVTTSEATKRLVGIGAGWVAAIVVLVIALVVAGYFYLQYQKSQALLKNPATAAQQEVGSLITKIGRLIELPTDEKPTVATVSDINKLKDQPFFKNARNGDKVLIYTKAKKAILYDPEADKIIEVGPINISGTQTASQSATTTTSTPTPLTVRVALYNGTTTTGLTSTAEKQLKEKLTTLVISNKANASKSDYTGTVVVDLSGTNKDIMPQIAGLVKGSIGSIPAGETKPKDADILIILGKDYAGK